MDEDERRETYRRAERHAKDAIGSLLLTGPIRGEGEFYVMCFCMELAHASLTRAMLRVNPEDVEEMLQRTLDRMVAEIPKEVRGAQEFIRMMVKEKELEGD